MPGGDSATGESGGTSNDAGSSGASMMVSVDDGSLVSFDQKGDPHGISQRWKKWKRSFGLYLTGKGEMMTDDAQKRGLLLHAAGVEVQEIYFTLVNEQ